jgi:hypothetical protein
MTPRRTRRARGTIRRRGPTSKPANTRPSVKAPQWVRCDFGEHSYLRAPSDDRPPYACPACRPKLPTRAEEFELATRDRARAARLRASAATAYQGPVAMLVCGMCGKPIVMPRDDLPICEACREDLPFGRSSTQIAAGDPFTAAREIGLSITDTDVAWLERRTWRPRETVEETLWCEAGAHEWVFPRIPGARPRSCPIHSKGEHPHTQKAWPGDVADCFLIDGRWATRLFVDAPLIRGATWRIPTPIANGLGIDDERSLRPGRPILEEPLLLKPPRRGNAGGSIATALRAVEAIEGDFVFVTLSPRTYDVVARRRRELVATDAIGRLLWGCGISPTDQDARSRPWHAVARAIGGPPPSRDALRERLLSRGNLDLVTALDDVRMTKTLEPTEGPWPPGWEFTAQLDPDETRFGLRNGDRELRIAVGLAESFGETEGLIVDLTGICWAEVDPDEGDPFELDQPNAGWIRWKRAEHHAVRASLAGASWRLLPSVDGWRLDDGSPTVDLADALDAVPTTIGQPRAPEVPIRSPSLRSAFAYERLARRAVDSGLLHIEAVPGVGISATFENGERTEGATLPDVLAPVR